MAKVTSEAISTFNEWKIGKGTGKYLIFRLENVGSIALTKIGPSTCTWEELCSELKEDQPLWAVYPFSYNTKENAKRSKTVMLQWIPSRANVREKMQYSMWTNVLKQSLGGIHSLIQAGDVDDVAYDNVLERVSRFERDEM